MLRLICPSALLAILVPASVQASDTTLAGWTFSQFLIEGAPSVDINAFDPVDSIVATYRGNFDPDSRLVDGTLTSINGNSYTDDTFGSWAFSKFDFSNAFDVRSDTFGALNTTNSTNLDGKRMHLTDSAGMMLTFNATDTLWSVKVNGTVGYANASTSDFTYAARGNGGTATVEWLFNGEVFSTSEIQAGSFGVYEAELPAAFYGNGLIEGRLVSGSVSFDNVQVNGQLGTPPTISVPPESLVRLVGQSATFSVEVTGAVSPTFQWFNGSTPIPGATAASYSINTVTLSDAGAYRVTVRSANGTTADSSSATLDVRQAPSILQEPATQSANPGQTVSFTVVAFGSPTPTFRWQRGGVDLSDGGNISGATTSTLTLSAVTAADEGLYRAVVSNVVSIIESASAPLTVSAEEVAPSVSTAPVDVVSVVGASVDFVVVASGAPAPAYQWFIGDSPLADGDGITGSATSILTLSNLTASRAGVYRVVISNSAGSVEREAALVVQTPPMIVSGPGPEVRSVLAGTTVTFTAGASGDPAPSFRWLRNGVELADVGNITGSSGATLTVASVTEADEGAYSVRATNAAGSATSGTSTLSVGRSAMITDQPDGALIAVGDTLSLQVTATGRPAPTYQWLKNGEIIDDATNATFVISGASATSAGSYTVKVTNEFATETSAAAVVRVAQPVSFARPSVPAVFVPGSTLSLGSTEAEVSPALRYVWYRNGKVIPGASGTSLFIESASFADSGSYILRIFGVGNRLLGSRLIATLQITVAGDYDAMLLAPADQLPVGAVTLKVAAKGGFTGTLRHEDGKLYSWSGTFDFPAVPDQGQATVIIRRGSLAPIILELELDATSGQLVVRRRMGTDAAVTGSGLGLARVTTKSAPWAGTYSLALNSLDDSADMMAAVVINSRASLQFRGTLPDGVRLTGSFASDVNAGYVIAFRPYSKTTGLFAGSLRLEASEGAYFADEDSSGIWTWTRSASGSRPAVAEQFSPSLAP